MHCFFVLESILRFHNFPPAAAPFLLTHFRVGRESTKDLMEALQRLPISFGMANRLRPQCQVPLHSRFKYIQATCVERWGG